MVHFCIVPGCTSSSSKMPHQKKVGSVFITPGHDGDVNTFSVCLDTCTTTELTGDQSGGVEVTGN